MKRITLFSIFVAFSLIANVITRNDMINTASQYIPPIPGWTPVVDSTTAVTPTWHSFYKTAENGGTPPYDRLSYCWSGFDTPWDFKARVEDENSPVPAGGYNTKDYGSVAKLHIAGIDCAGFVLRCWGFSTYITYEQLLNNSLKIEESRLKKGDLMRWPGWHIVLYYSGTHPNCIVYESQASSGTGVPYPGVSLSPERNFDNYYACSIFPQFSDAQPPPGSYNPEQEIDLSLTIWAKGEVSSDHIYLVIDGESVTGFTLDPVTDTTWILSYHKDFEDSGAHIVEVTADNYAFGSGHYYRDEYHWGFYTGVTPPVVISTTPGRGASKVLLDIDPIIVLFSKPMDHSSISSISGYTITWSGEDKMFLHPTEYFEYCDEVTITIPGTMKDTSGIKLDGDEDGEPGGDYIFTFSTEIPAVDVEAWPEVGHIEMGETEDHHVLSKGDELKKDVDCLLEFEISNPGGWSISGADNTNFNLSPGDNYQKDYTVTNVGATEALDVQYKVGVECALFEEEGYYWSAEGHMADHPDDNQVQQAASYETPWFYRTGRDSTGGLPPIGILLSGWSDGFGHILGGYNIPTTPVKPNLKILNHPDITLSDSVKLLVIGSAALNGINSGILKDRLTEYVQDGGVLLVFTQKFGSDLSALPGDVGGYGWEEDQSCIYSAAYLDQWHPAFSGQNRVQINCGMDGYINQFPSNSTILLRRTASGMPGLLYYPFGNGYVIVSGMYSDWAYGHNQLSEGEKLLLRDLTTWALEPDVNIPEFYSGELISPSVILEYMASETLPAYNALLKVYTPDRDLYHIDTFELDTLLYPGEIKEISMTGITASSDFGIWPVHYILLDSCENQLQDERMGGRFAVKNDISVGNYNLGNFLIWANSNKEHTQAGTPVQYYIYARNNTDTEFDGKIMIGVHEDGGSWWRVIDSITEVTIPPDTFIMFEYETPLFLSTSMYFGLYENDTSYYPVAFSNAIVRCHKGIWVEESGINVDVSLDKFRYLYNRDTVNYDCSIRYLYMDNDTVVVNLYTELNTVRYDISSDTFDCSSSGSFSITGKFFPFDYDLCNGNQFFGCELYAGDQLLFCKKRNFNILYAVLPCSVDIPDSIQYGVDNFFTVYLMKSVGMNFRPEGMLVVSSGEYRDSVMLPFSEEPETTLVFNFGGDLENMDSKIYVTYLYGEQVMQTTSAPLFVFPCVSLLKPEYPWVNSGFLPGDTAQFRINVRGTGKVYGAPLIVSLWSNELAQDTLSDTVFVFPDSCEDVVLRTYADTLISSGVWIGYSYRLRYPGKEFLKDMSQGYHIAQTEAILNWPFNDTFAINDTIPIRYTNRIKGTSQVKIDSVVLSGNEVSKKFDGPGIVDVPPESSYTFSIVTPLWKEGNYNLKVFASMIYGIGRYFGMYPKGCPIFIDGIEADISVSTPQYYYEQGEDIPFSSHLTNGNYGWNGVESLSVYRTEDVMGQFSIWDLGSSSVDSFGVIAGDSGLILDSLYSLRNIYSKEFIDFTNKQEVLGQGQQGFSLYSAAKDEWDNFWFAYNDSGLIQKRNSPFGDVITCFDVPDSVGFINGILPYMGVLYLTVSDSGRIYKLNSVSGELMGYIQPPYRRFFGLTGVAVKENGNILAVESGTYTLWEFSGVGDSISAFPLPESLLYGDMDYRDGTIYISAFTKIIKIEGTTIDSFGMADSSCYSSLAVDDNGNLAAYNGNNIVLFAATGEIEVESGCTGFIDDLIFYRGDIVSMEEEILGYIKLYRKFGKNSGLIRFSNPGNTPDMFRFIDFEPVEDINSGSITYEGGYGDYGNFISEGLLPLEEFYGYNSLPPVYITLNGDWQDSPVFNDLLLKLFVFNDIDSTIITDTLDLDLLPYENVILSDTIRDTIPPGDYLVVGKAHSDYPQFISYDYESFTVIGDNITLILKTDREEGPPGDTFHINPVVINPTLEEKDSLHFLIRGYCAESETTYIDTIFDIEADGIDSFPFFITPTEPLEVRAELFIPPDDTIYREFVPIINGEVLTIALYASEIVNLLPFGVRSELRNLSPTSLNLDVKRIFLSDTLTDAITLASGGIFTFLDSFETTVSDTIEVIASSEGNVYSRERFVYFGINGEILLDTVYNVASDSIMLNSIISNNGVYPEGMKCLFCLFDDGRKRTGMEGMDKLLPGIKTTRRIDSFESFIESAARNSADTSIILLSLIPDEAETVTVNFDSKEPGAYTLKAYLFTDTSDIFLDSTSSIVNVAEYALVSIDSLILSPCADSMDSVQILVLMSNSSYSEFFGTLNLSSPFFVMETGIEIPYTKQETLSINLPVPEEGIHEFTIELRDGGVVKDVYQEDLAFASQLLPVYIPSLSLSPGDTTHITFRITNAGNGHCEGLVSIDWIDMIDVDYDTVLTVNDTFEFSPFLYVPEDLGWGRYFSYLTVLREGIVKLDTFASVQVNGMRVESYDSLDMMFYSIGDTADMYIMVKNTCELMDTLLLSYSYDALEMDTAFLPGWMEKGVIGFGDTLYLDSVYLLEPINVSSYDSLRFTWISSDSIGLYFRTDSLWGEGDWVSVDSTISYSSLNYSQIKIENTIDTTGWCDRIIMGRFDGGWTDTIIDDFPSQLKVIEMAVPVTKENGSYSYGIHLKSGRSVIIDGGYIYTLNDSFSVYTEKDRYYPGDTVYAGVIKQIPGSYDFSYRVYFLPPDSTTDILSLSSDTTDFSFVVPDTVLSGTYRIKWVVEDSKKRKEEVRSIGKVRGDTLSSGNHPFDVCGIEIYFKFARMDKDVYGINDTSRVFMDISSNTEFDGTLKVTSTGGITEYFDLWLSDTLPNRLTIDYAVTGNPRGYNNLYLYVMKDSSIYAGKSVVFDVEVPDTIPPVISLIEKPGDTFNQATLYEITARVIELDTTIYKTPISDTLYYRVTEGGGEYFSPVLPHCISGDTHNYYIPAQTGGSRMEWHIVARDSGDNYVRYPEEVEEIFWVLSPLTPALHTLTYTADTTVTLIWSPPVEEISYHQGIRSDVLNVGGGVIGCVHYYPQYSPARLMNVRFAFVADTILSKSLDTVLIKLIQPTGDMPGNVIDSLQFIISADSGVVVFDLLSLNYIIPEEGVYIGVETKDTREIYTDGISNPSHSYVYEDGWEISDAGEIISSAQINYLPGGVMRFTDVLSFTVYRSEGDTAYIEMVSGFSDTIYYDTTVVENKNYSYRVGVEYSLDSMEYCSNIEDIFVDLTLPEMDTQWVEMGDSFLTMKAVIWDTSGIVDDTLYYLSGDSLVGVLHDSVSANLYYYTTDFPEDTLYYFLIAYDGSASWNRGRWPEEGYFWWYYATFISEDTLPVVTKLFNLPGICYGDMKIRFALARKERVRINLYDCMGRLVKKYMDEEKGRGYYSIPAKFRERPMGVYFLIMEAGDYTTTRKMVLLR